jgi:hypothetical protein
MRVFQKVSIVGAKAVRPLYVAAVPLYGRCKFVAPRLGFSEVLELGVELGIEHDRRPMDVRDAMDLYRKASKMYSANGSCPQQGDSFGVHIFDACSAS